MLGGDVGDSDETFRREFLTALDDRSLTGVRLVIFDAHAGFIKAIGRDQSLASGRAMSGQAKALAASRRIRATSAGRSIIRSWLPSMR
jgi:hypothetical protein